LADSYSESGFDLISFFNQQICYGVKDPVESFIGRKRKLWELEGLIQNCMQSAVVISGLGGMGKSELLKKYISVNKSKIPICQWVNGESAETLRSSFEQFAAFINVAATDERDGRPLELLGIVNNILIHVKKEMIAIDKGNYTVMIDKVENQYDDLMKVVKQLFSYPRSTVIITSRRRDLLLEESEILELSEWTEKEAMEYVTRSLNRQQKLSDVKILCKTLKFHPLSISQAVDYILHQQRILPDGQVYDIENYLAEHQFKGKLLPFPL